MGTEDDPDSGIAGRLAATFVLSVCVECPLDEERLSDLLHLAFVTAWRLDESKPIIVS